MTALGIDNYGRMTYRYGYEEIDYVDGTSDWVWNAPQHVLFLRIRELFDSELCALYTRLESLGAWSATGLINQFNEWQAEFPEELWRVDIERKYIRTYTSSYINGAARPEFLKERANGRKKTQRAQFEKNQEKYMSSKFGGNVAAADDIIMRCSVPNTTLAVTPNFDIHLTPYSYIYLNVKYNTSPPIKVRAVPNVEYTIEYDSDLADIIEIYSASCIKSIGDLSPLYLTNGDFGNASKIRELKLGSDVSGYDNTNVMTLGLGANKLLTKLDIQNMSGLSSSLDLSTLKNLEELYAFGSKVSGVIFADGGNVATVQIPAIGSLQMKNLSYLLDDGFEATSYSNLTRLVAENSMLDLITIINNASNLYQARLVGVDWSLDDTTILERLYDLAGVTNTGGNTDRAVLSGKVHVPVIRQQQLYDYQAAWPDLEITFDTMIEQFAVTFVNDDGTVLDVQYVDKGEDAVDPVTRTDNPIPTPTKASTISTNFTYAGWDSSLKSIFAPRTITATYTESTRTYTIKYVSKGITLQESTGLYGENVVYTGSTPTYTLEESGYKYYLFNRWDKSGFIDGDKTVNAIFDSFTYTATAFQGKQLSDLTPVEVYALTQLGVDNVDIDLQEGDDYSFELGHDVDYDDIEAEVVIAEKTVFNGTNYVDTNIKLFDVDRDFVLAIDYKFTDGNETNSVLAQCFQSNGSNGFKLVHNNGIKLMWGTTSTNVSSVNKREMVVIRHKKGDNNLTVYSSNLGSTVIGVEELTRTKETTADSTLVFGCLKADDGAYESYAKGEINWCKVWYADLGDSTCRNLAAWTHERVNLEVCGFKKYYLSDNPSKRCSFTLLASNLLSCSLSYGTTWANVSWADSTLNQFLNARLYNALPVQIQLLTKRVTVTSSVGSRSTETSTSECYIFVPSAIELSNQSEINKEPYTNEASYTISYMTGNDMRKRAYVDGDYYSYWTRSPNIEYTYMWTVNENGEMYGFSGASDTLGVVIQLCF